MTIEVDFIKRVRLAQSRDHVRWGCPDSLTALKQCYLGIEMLSKQSKVEIRKVANSDITILLQGLLRLLIDSN